MGKLSERYRDNIEVVNKRLGIDENFDIIKRRMTVANREICFFYIDGFVKDGEMQKIMQYLLSKKEFGGAEELFKTVPYVEVAFAYDYERVISSVLAGQSVLFSESFGAVAIILDMRTYPMRSVSEPDSDRVMQGSHDGFVETLVMNTALIRRRIRDERLTMEHFSMGGASGTDVVLCYVKGKANEKNLSEIREKLINTRPKTLTLGFQSLAETLIQKGWYNPFPKIRTTERPDTAAAEVLEGRILVICDTSPQVMILPTAVFDFLQQTDDYYFPPLTGTYLRIVRMAILILSVIVTPIWYLYLEYADFLPDALRFLIPDEPGAVPIILQLFLVEFAVDGLKIASMNTPDMLSNSLSIVGALILGDFAVDVGWLSGDVILYMAFIAIATFAQQNNELGYAFKFIRMITLLLVYIFGIWGFALGMALFVFLIATNNTVLGRKYLYPLIPCNPKAMKKLLIRERKQDFE